MTRIEGQNNLWNKITAELEKNLKTVKKKLKPLDEKINTTLQALNKKVENMKQSFAESKEGKELQKEGKNAVKKLGETLHELQDLGNKAVSIFQNRLKPFDSKFKTEVKHVQQRLEEAAAQVEDRAKLFNFNRQCDNAISKEKKGTFTAARYKEAKGDAKSAFEDLQKARKAESDPEKVNEQRQNFIAAIKWPIDIIKPRKLD